MRSWIQQACTLAAVIALSGASVARAQEALADDDTLAGADMGFATGEPSLRGVPYAPESQTEPEPASDLYGRWQQWKANLQRDTGTTFDLYLNPSDQVILSGPGSGNNRGIAWYNLHVGQQLWSGAQLLVNTRGGEGNGVNRYADSLFNVNQHAGESTWIYVSHLFLQQKLFDDKVTISAGKLDLLDFFDANEVASWNLIPYSLARNPSIPAPFHAIGATGRWDAAPWLYVQAGIADAGGNARQTGLNTAFDGNEPYFSIYEVGIKAHLLDRPGTYRGMVWYNSGDIARFDGSGSKSGDVGFALSCDQQITDHLSLFGRYGYSDPHVRRFNHYLSFGASYSEPIAGRTKDVLGAEVAEALVSDDFRDAAGGDSTETQCDLYYKIQVNAWLSITPDLQIILNPDQDQSEAAVVIAGVYAEMHF